MTQRQKDSFALVLKSKFRPRFFHAWEFLHGKFPDASPLEVKERFREWVRNIFVPEIRKTAGSLIPWGDLPEACAITVRVADEIFDEIQPVTGGQP